MKSHSLPEMAQNKYNVAVSTLFINFKFNLLKLLYSFEILLNLRLGQTELLADLSNSKTQRGGLRT